MIARALLLLGLEPPSASVTAAPPARGANEIELRLSSGAAPVREDILAPLAFTGPGTTRSPCAVHPPQAQVLRESAGGSVLLTAWALRDLSSSQDVVSERKAP
jgi:hypothetical protein